MSEMPERCRPFDEDLSAWIDGELGTARAAEVEAHLRSCGRCAAREAALRGLDEQLRARARRPGVEEVARLARIHAGLAVHRSGAERAAGARIAAAARSRAAAPRARRRWLAPAGLVAAAAAAGFLALVVPRWLERSAVPNEVAETRAQRAAPVAPKASALRLEDVPRVVARSEAPLGASAPPAGAGQALPAGASADSLASAEAGAETPAPSAAAPADAGDLAVLEQAGDDELSLALGLGTIDGIESADDLALVEHLDLVERLAELDRGGRG